MFYSLKYLQHDYIFLSSNSNNVPLYHSIKYVTSNKVCTQMPGKLICRAVKPV